MSMEKRQFFRYATCVPVKFSTPSRRGRLFRYGYHISAGGCQIFVKGDCQNLNYVVLNIHLPIVYCWTLSTPASCTITGSMALISGNVHEHRYQETKRVG